MPASIPYKSFCWNFGTTSFRTKNFNKTIEDQLRLLDDFWKLPENKKDVWKNNNKLQTRYYDYMQKRNFVDGEASKKDKDAREKTSGLVEIGLIDEGRHLTEAGNALLQICQKNDFSSDNFFEIPKDSYIYLKQLLKTSVSVNAGTVVRPFIVFLYVLSNAGELSLDEFTYLLPLCTSEECTKKVIEGITAVKDGKTEIDNIILDRLMNMDNYKRALNTLLCSTKVTEDLLCEVGLNRKSRSYDKAYFPLYQLLYSAYIKKQNKAFSDVYNATDKIKIGKWWRSYLFKNSSLAAIKNNPLACINSTLFKSVSNEKEFRTAFFKVMHLLKAKATLSDYCDLNRRYVKISDIVLFEDNIVKLDIVPRHFFKSVIDNLYKDAYTASPKLGNDCPINSIASCLNINEQAVINSVNTELDAHVTTITEAHAALEKKRYERLKHLIDKKFTDAQILALLDLFEKRKDAEIKSMVTDNADVPTIFEYVLAILWYKLSEQQGKILDYMKLSLDADLLPKTHAAGGEADIVYEYESTEYYPEHTLLIEATLTDSTNQRRMEMEPVSRHLGQHLLRTKNFDSYCVFVTNHLDINVISDFRGRKHMPYYAPQDSSQYVNGMKIIPLETAVLKHLIQNSKTYKELYPIFDKAFNADALPHNWYKNYIKNQFCVEI